MNTIQLIDGRAIRLDHLEFEADTHRFWFGTEDVTNQMYRRDKEAHFWQKGFSSEKDNLRLFIERPVSGGGAVPKTIPKPLETSVIRLAASGIAEDLKQTGDLISSTATRMIPWPLWIIAGGILLLYLAPVLLPGLRRAFR